MTTLIKTTSPRQDKFGFYQVGDFKTYSKFEAAEQCVKINKPLQWNFNQEIYSSYNWALEPTETLSELYCQRAQQLRDQYDYLVLWFSGGADSTNILNAFLDNNIKLDEVASYVNYEATSSKHNWLNGEIYNVAAPTITLAKEKQPWLQHTIVDISKLIVDFFQKTDAKFDWIYQVNTYVNPNNVARQDMKLLVPHWIKMFDQGKKVGFIYGTDKPRVSNINGNYYFRFVDVTDPAVNAATQMKDRPWEFNELFYWTPDNAKIVIKQGHVLKNYLKLATEDSEFISTDRRASTVTTVINRKIYGLTSAGLHKLIYPGWFPVPYQAKPSTLIFTPRDDWFFELSESESAKYSWKTGLEHRWKTVPEFLKRDPLDISKGFKNTLSPPYHLGS